MSVDTLGVETLTPTELATLRAVADGLTYKEVAERSRCVALTIKARMAVIRAKLGAATTAAAIAQGFRRGILA